MMVQTEKTLTTAVAIVFAASMVYAERWPSNVTTAVAIGFAASMVYAER
jgi:hypothetical protein